MYKAFLLILCLLVSPMMVLAQQRAPQAPPFNPNVQRILDNINAMSPEQRARLRESTLAWLEERHASEQRTIPLQNQNPLTSFAGMSPLGGLLYITQDPNLRKYGPLGPSVKYGLLGPLGDDEGVQQSANSQSNLGNLFNLPKGFTPLDGVSQSLDWDFKELDLSLQRIDASTNAAIDALKLLQQQIAASNETSVLRPTGRVLQPPPSASAASVRKQSGLETLMPPFDRVSRSCLEQIKKDPTIRCVTDDYAYLRSDPKSFFVNTLQYGDYFRVLARHYVKEKCWYYGDAFGSVNQHHVWIECDHLDGLDIHPDPKEATERQFHRSGPDIPGSVSTREYLETRYGTLLFETPQCNNGFWLAQPRLPDGSAANRIDIYGTRDPETGKLSNIRTTVELTTKDTIRVRYITPDGSAAAVNVEAPGQTIGEGVWGFAEIGRIRFVEPKKVPQNDNLLVRCQ